MMYSNAVIPLRLKIVAVLFILFGAMDIVKMILAPFQNQLTINTGPLAVLVGFGLLALRPGWRTCGLVLLWISMLLLPVLVAMEFFIGGSAEFKLFGQVVGQVPILFSILYTAALFCLSLWQYRVLTQIDIRALFIPNT